MLQPSAVRGFLVARMIPMPGSLGFLLALALSIASSFDAAAQTGAPASGTQDGATGTVTTPSSAVKERRFAPGTIAKTIIEEASRLTNDAVAWGTKLKELELELRNGAPHVETVRKHVDECIVVLQAVAERLAPKSDTRISLQRQEDAIRDLANRAEVRAEQSIRKIAGYLQQKTTEFHALNRSMEETRIQLIAQIDQLQELKEELNFNHAAAQNGDPLNGAKTTLAHLQALTADAQRVANDLDSFGANPSVTGKPADLGASVEAAKRR
jgi:hypothetical protein